MSNSQSGTIANGWFIALGVLLILTGIAALTFPFVATLSVEILVGTAFLFGGIVTVIHAFRQKEWRGFFWQMAIGLLHLAAGIVFLVAPIGGAVVLTLLLGCVFAAEGIARMVLAFQIRPETSWGWVLASGGVALLIGGLILAGMANGASLAFIGFLVGINFVAAGASTVTLGMGEERLEVASPA